MRYTWKLFQELGGGHAQATLRSHCPQREVGLGISLWAWVLAWWGLSSTEPQGEGQHHPKYKGGSLKTSFSCRRDLLSDHVLAGSDILLGVQEPGKLGGKGSGGGLVSWREMAQPEFAVMGVSWREETSIG